MEEIGVRELKARTSDILRRVRDDGESFAITHRGRMVARLIPVIPPRHAKPDPAETAAIWAEMDEIAKEIAKHWPAGVSAVDAVREGRREL